MNIIHIRSTTNAKNPGPHPIGSIGAIKEADAIIFVACATAHGDQFSKKVARNILKGRLKSGRFTTRLVEDHASIHDLAKELGINQALRKRLYAHDWQKAQMALDNMIVDLAIDNAFPTKPKSKPKKKA